MSKQGTLASHVLGISILFGFVAQVDAEIVRSQAQIRTLPVQGVTLSMTPRQAFETLVERGYSAANIKSFEDWRSGAIQMVRGSPEDPLGESFVGLGRIPGQLINISEETNKRHGERLDYEAEIAELKLHFGVTKEEPECSVNTDRGAGICSVSDGNKEKLFAFVCQVRPILRSVQLGYVFEQTVGLDDHN